MLAVGDIVAEAAALGEGRIGVVVDVFHSGNVLVRLDHPEVYGIPAPCNCEIFLPHVLLTIGRDDARHKREVERQALIAARREQAGDDWEPEPPATAGNIEARMEREIAKQMSLFG